MDECNEFGVSRSCKNQIRDSLRKVHVDKNRLKFNPTDYLNVVNSGYTTYCIYDFLQRASTNSMHNTRRHRYKLIIICTCKTLLNLILFIT